jgi:hypothetical protein
MNKWTDERTDRQTVRNAEREMNGLHTYLWKYLQIDRRMDGQADR